MNEIITEKKFPIRNIWLLKGIVGQLIFSPLYFIYILNTVSETTWLHYSSFFIFIFLLALCIPICINLLRRANFHYSLDEKIMSFHQGVISKKQRSVAYGRIQGVFVQQRISDRIFGLASLTLEDFSGGGKSTMSVDGYVGSGRSRYEVLGFVGNKIHIPGLKKKDAESLKEIILQRVKENPIEDNQSGL